MNTVMSVLKPMFYMANCFGFAPFTLSTNSSNKRSLLCLCWGVILVIFNTIINYYAFIDHRNKVIFATLTATILDSLVYSLDYLAFNLSVLCSWIAYKNILEIIGNLETVHYRLLELDLKFLRLSKEYTKERLNINIVTFFVVFYVFGITTYMTIVYTNEYETPFLLQYLLGIFTHSTIIAELQFYALIYIVKQRFVWLNKILRTVVNDKRKSYRNIIFMSLSRSIYENYMNMLTVRRVGLLYSQLWSISKKLNKAYAFQTLLLSLQTFVFILNAIFFTLTTTINNKYNIPLKFYMIYAGFSLSFILSIISINIICSNTSKEAEETKQLFLQLKLQSQNNEYDFEILCISLQMLQNKINLSVFGLFTIDKKFIYLFFSAVVTYSILILQIDVATY